MKEIGIKLADGSFYPIMEDGIPCKKNLVLTTVKDNQTRVIVDVYRTKNRSVKDAEYIDSLQIDGLVPHPNGEVELPLNIGLDERNKLWATMNDPETGGTSDANVTLVSRTLEERLEPTNYEVVGGANLAEDEKTIAEDENPRFDVSEESAEIGPEIDSDFDMPDTLTDEEINGVAEDSPAEDDVASPEEENKSGGHVAAAALAGAAGIGLLAKAEKINIGNSEEEIAPETEQETAEEAVLPPDSEVMEQALEQVVEQTPEQQDVLSPDKETAEQSTEQEEVLPPIDETVEATEDSTVEGANFDEPLPEIESNAGEEIAASEDPFGDTLDLDLPDFTDDGTLSNSLENEEIPEETPNLVVESVEEMPTVLDGETSNAEGEPLESEPVETVSMESDVIEPELEPKVAETEIEQSAGDSADTLVENSLDDPFGSDVLPDMDDDFGNDIFADDNAGDDISDNGNTDILTDDDFDMPGLDDDTIENRESSVDYNEVKSPSIGGIDFGGLYDKETEDGNPSYNEDEDMSKKTRAPVIICVVCAIICLLATALVLFVVPSKYNLLNKKAETEKEAVVVENETEKIDENIEEEAATADILEENEEEFFDEEVPNEEPSTEAKEDEVVVVTEPEIVETVVPEPTPEPEVKPADIVYKIKWGDTLWDISEAYYKTPWKYPKIARYNNIRDPDYIISGTTISIPAE